MSTLWRLSTGRMIFGVLAGATVSLAGHGHSEIYELSCSYTLVSGADDPSPNQVDFEWDQYEQCARLDQEGCIRIDPAHLERMRLEDGLASVLIESRGWYYVRPGGASLSVIAFDNGPDPWSEGLVRGRRDGKIVYLSRLFEEVTGHRYDWGWPFKNGHALVCRGCALEDSEEEHSAVVGGSWWFIDHAGNEVERDHLSEAEISRLERRARLR